MRFLLDPRLHLLLIAAMIFAVAIGFRAEQEWQRFVDSPLSIVEGSADCQPFRADLD